MAPNMQKALMMQKVEGKPGQVYYPLLIAKTPIPTPGSNELLIRMTACSLNHRDLFLRQHLYPSPSFTTPLLCDGCGIVVSRGPSTSATWLNKRIVLNPSRGWVSSRDGPESNFATLGGTGHCPLGTAQEYLLVHSSEVVEAPAHLSDAEAASLPLAGLTAWRALVTKSRNAEKERNILVTGVGGGVAQFVCLFAREMGVRVWVTSGQEDKIREAKERLGVDGGVCYKEVGWERQLGKMLPADRRYLDAVIDGAGGDIVGKAVRLLKPGGVIVQYGLTVAPKMDWHIAAVLKNIELRGTSMGSRDEFRDMIAFVNERKIRPVVSKVAHGLDNLPDVESLFEDMKSGSQFGKLVIELERKKALMTRL